MCQGLFPTYFQDKFYFINLVTNVTWNDHEKRVDGFQKQKVW